jgi:16S rRNA (cytidine1402-2'-O)-methyltransferase
MAKLFIVPTPIGNLEDLTFRALRLLQECDVIFAEDTRHTSKLLQHYSISKPLVSFHSQNEHKTLLSCIEKIKQNKNCVLVSDAGTPGISDPGFLLIRECIKQEIEVECLPGATAFVPALVMSGIPCNQFVFEGFLPQKKGRKTRIDLLASEARTLVFYESPYRLSRLIEELIVSFGGDRYAVVCRELSKIYEEKKRGNLLELREYYLQHPPKGEIVVIVEGIKN